MINRGMTTMISRIDSHTKLLILPKRRATSLATYPPLKSVPNVTRFKGSFPARLGNRFIAPPIPPLLGIAPFKMKKRLLVIPHVRTIQSEYIGVVK